MALPSATCADIRFILLPTIPRYYGATALFHVACAFGLRRALEMNKLKSLRAEYVLAISARFVEIVLTNLDRAICIHCIDVHGMTMVRVGTNCHVPYPGLCIHRNAVGASRRGPLIGVAKAIRHRPAGLRDPVGRVADTFAIIHAPRVNDPIKRLFAEYLRIAAATGRPHAGKSYKRHDSQQHHDAYCAPADCPSGAMRKLVKARQRYIHGPMILQRNYQLLEVDELQPVRADRGSTEVAVVIGIVLADIDGAVAVD